MSVPLPHFFGNSVLNYHFFIFFFIFFPNLFKISRLFLKVFFNFKLFLNHTLIHSFCFFMFGAKVFCVGWCNASCSEIFNYSLFLEDSGGPEKDLEIIYSSGPEKDQLESCQVLYCSCCLALAACREDGGWTGVC